MDPNLDRVMNDVLSLDRESQVLIAEKIVGALGESREHTSLWRQEVKRRLEEIDAAQIPMREARDVLAEAKARIRK